MILSAAVACRILQNNREPDSPAHHILCFRLLADVPISLAIDRPCAAVNRLPKMDLAIVELEQRLDEVVVIEDQRRMTAAQIVVSNRAHLNQAVRLGVPVAEPLIGGP